MKFLIPDKLRRYKYYYSASNPINQQIIKLYTNDYYSTLKVASIVGIEQEQDPTQHFVTKNRKLSEAWRRYAEIANPQLVPRDELIDYLEEKEYFNVKIYEKEVPDNKTMVGFVFERKN